MSLALRPLRTYSPISGLVGRPAHHTPSRARARAHEARLPGPPTPPTPAYTLAAKKRKGKASAALPAQDNEDEDGDDVFQDAVEHQGTENPAKKGPGYWQLPESGVEDNSEDEDGEDDVQDFITFADEPELETADSFFPRDYLDWDVLPMGDREFTLDEFKRKHEAAIAFLRLRLSLFLVFNTKFTADMTYKSYAELPEDEVVRLLAELSPRESWYAVELLAAAFLGLGGLGLTMERFLWPGGSSAHSGAYISMRRRGVCSAFSFQKSSVACTWASKTFGGDPTLDH